MGIHCCGPAGFIISSCFVEGVGPCLCGGSIRCPMSPVVEWLNVLFVPLRARTSIGPEDDEVVFDHDGDDGDDAGDFSLDDI